MNQEEIRFKLIKFFVETGVKQKHVCLLIGLAEPELSRFKNGKDLHIKYLNRLERYLLKFGY